VRVNRRDAYEMGNATLPGAQPHSNEVSNTDIHRFTHVYGDNFPNPCIKLMHTPPPHFACPSLLCDAAGGGLLRQTVEKEVMKILIRAAMAALSIASIGSAYAGDGEGPAANTQFTEIPGVVAQAPVQNAPVFANAQNGQALHAYVARSSHGTWLFAPDQNGGGDN